MFSSITFSGTIHTVTYYPDMMLTGTVDAIRYVTSMMKGILLFVNWIWIKHKNTHRHTHTHTHTLVCTHIDARYIRGQSKTKKKILFVVPSFGKYGLQWHLIHPSICCLIFLGNRPKLDTLKYGGVALENIRDGLKGVIGCLFDLFEGNSSKLQMFSTST